MSCERWISIIKLRKRAYAPLCHLIFISDQHAFDEAQPGNTEHFEVRIGIEPEKPWSRRTLMYRILAFHWIADV